MVEARENSGEADMVGRSSLEAQAIAYSAVVQLAALAYNVVDPRSVSNMILATCCAAGDVVNGGVGPEEIVDLIEEMLEFKVVPDSFMTDPGDV